MTRKGGTAIVGWTAFLSLTFGAAECLLKYAGWSAVVSGYYGLPSHAQLVKEASHFATRWLWGLIGLGIAATALALYLLPLRLALARLVAALAVVVSLTWIWAYLLVSIGHHLH
jgi:hypothetical protein